MQLPFEKVRGAVDKIPVIWPHIWKIRECKYEDNDNVDKTAWNFNTEIVDTEFQFRKYSVPLSMILGSGEAAHFTTKIL